MATFQIALKKTVWKYFDSIEADNIEQAKDKAMSMLDENEMDDYGQGVVFEENDCWQHDQQSKV